MSVKSRARIIEAMDKYSPISLSNHLKRSPQGVVYFDREKLVSSDNEKAMFHYILNGDYDAGYKNADFLTVYFEICDFGIVAGGYDTSTGDKTSSRIVATTNEYSNSIRTPYTYTKETIEEFRNKIMNA